MKGITKAAVLLSNKQYTRKYFAATFLIAVVSVPVIANAATLQSIMSDYPSHTPFSVTLRGSYGSSGWQSDYYDYRSDLIAEDPRFPGDPLTTWGMSDSIGADVSNYMKNAWGTVLAETNSNEFHFNAQVGAEIDLKGVDSQVTHLVGSSAEFRWQFDVYETTTFKIEQLFEETHLFGSANINMDILHCYIGGSCTAQNLIDLSQEQQYITLDPTVGYYQLKGSLSAGYATMGARYGAIDYGLADGAWDVTLSAVPVPAAAWLFGSGLLGLIGVARRKKA